MAPKTSKRKPTIMDLMEAMNDSSNVIKRVRVGNAASTTARDSSGSTLTTHLLFPPMASLLPAPLIPSLATADPLLDEEQAKDKAETGDADGIETVDAELLLEILKPSSHLPAGTFITRCPLCPDPDMNMENEWWTTPLHLQHLIMMYTMLDRNSKTRRFRKRGGKADHSLYHSKSYFDDDAKYARFLKKAAKKKFNEPIPDCDNVKVVTQLTGLATHSMAVTAQRTRQMLMEPSVGATCSYLTAHELVIALAQLEDHMLEFRQLSHVHEDHVAEWSRQNLIPQENPKGSNTWTDVYHCSEKEPAPTVASVLESIAQAEGGGISLAIPKVGLDLEVYWRRAFEVEEIRQV
ncbi:hypothetical protein PQX77_017576 [Marasmius sp. AFHP31]|nr:hypothetical protein PQX77_017576 [Marasmius sp. AFHP31]